MKEIRIAIIGTGMISHRHMTVIQNLQWLQAMQMQRFFMMHRKNTARSLLYRSAPFTIHRHVLQRR